MLAPLLVMIALTSVRAHEYYNGRCLKFVTMADLDWERFSGDWWVVLKMNSRSSCIRYNYSTSGGEKLVTEQKLLPVLGRFGVPSSVQSQGRLRTTNPASVAAMTVDWDTGVLGDLMFSDMDYLVLDTDYTTRALVCSCQHFNIGFFAVNRRSCDYMIVSRNLYSTADTYDPVMFRDQVREPNIPGHYLQTTGLSWTLCPPTSPST